MRALLAIGIALGMTIPHIRSAEACGIKVTVKASKIKRTKRSSNPGTVLILGERDTSLARELRNAGHTVEQASSLQGAPRSDYALVLADENLMPAATSRFRNSNVVMKKGSRRSNAKRVELALRRTARPGNKGRIRIAKETRDPIAAGPDNRQPASGQLGTDTVPTTTEQPTRRSTPSTTNRRTKPVASKTTTKPKTRVAARTPKAKTEPKAKAEPKAKTEPKAKAETKVAVNTKTPPPVAAEPDPVDEPAVADKPVKAARWTGEFSFGMNRSNLKHRAKKRLRSNARWMEQNPDSTITIEGHTDTTGSAEYNMVLSEQRAQAAKDFLIGLGIDGSRIEISARGEEEPAYEPGTSGKNRRIVLKRN